MERSRICPATMVTADSREWLGLRPHYMNGFLAVAGGVLDQPNAYLEAMALIDHWVNKDGSGS